ncbi:MAG: hypothetical protein PHP93_00970 [Kiritimatiellales bacterium]|nr:hypothetical protein [Kiritimatiellales bacterium]
MTTEYRHRHGNQDVIRNHASSLARSVIIHSGSIPLQAISAQFV